MHIYPNRYPERNQSCHNAIWVNCRGWPGWERGGGRVEWDRCTAAHHPINCKHTIRNVLRAAGLDRCPCERGGGRGSVILVILPRCYCRCHYAFSGSREARACVGVCEVVREWILAMRRQEIFPMQPVRLSFFESDLRFLVSTNACTVKFLLIVYRYISLWISLLCWYSKIVFYKSNIRFILNMAYLFIVVTWSLFSLHVENVSINVQKCFLFWESDYKF